MEKISIIVPVYNAEKYLKKSIESILEQTYKNLEIILINDGSTDNSLKICREYSQLDERIIIIDKVNEGVSIARNLGIERATGDFIAFLDADDWIELNMFENILRNIKENNSDIGMCNYFRDGNISTKVSFPINESCLVKSEIIENILANIIGPKYIGQSGDLLGYRGVVMYIYKRELLNLNKIRFNENIHLGEDLLFNISALSVAKALSINDNAYYHYRMNFGSATQGYRNNYWEEHLKLIQLVESRLINLQLYDVFFERVNVMKINYVISGIINESHKDNKNNFYNKIKYIKTMLNDNMFEDTIKNVDYGYLSFCRKVWFNLLKYKQATLLYIYYKLTKFKRLG